MRNAQVPVSPPHLFPDHPAVVIWRDDEHAWRVGPPCDPRSPALRAVLAAATGGDWSAGCVAAWSLLLRVDFTTAGTVEALQQEASGELPDAQDLSPLLVRLAWQQPQVVAGMFPVVGAVAPSVLALCGEHGLRAALGALHCGQAGHRLAAALSLIDLAGAGQAVPPAPLRVALRTEPDRDVADALHEALAAVDGLQ